MGTTPLKKLEKRIIKKLEKRLFNRQKGVMKRFLAYLGRTVIKF